MEGCPHRFRNLSTLPVQGVPVPIATTQLARLLGLALLPRETAGSGLLIPRCRSVHTFGMRFPIEVVFLDRELEPIRTAGRVMPGRFISDRRASAVLELVLPRGETTGSHDLSRAG